MPLPLKKWKKKVAVITGASSGIGAATAERLVKEGLIVVGLARRIEKINELSKKLKHKKGKLYAVQADITKEEDIINAFNWTTKNVGPVSILINNAGLFSTASPVNGKTEEWQECIDINVIGVCITAREAIKIMKDHNIDGHIINLNSLAGHMVVPVLLSIYTPSKFAVTALTETLRLELAASKSKIKVTSLSPGPVETPLLSGALQGTGVTLEALKTEDITNAIVYILSTPPHVQIQELMIRPVLDIH